MEKRHGLGRGLGSLLGEFPREDGLRQLQLDKIDANPQQPRRSFDPDALLELEHSIRELGVLVPIIVRQKGERYELIAGERRCRASRAAGLTLIPAMVREASDESSLELAVVENLQREDLDAIEEAMGFAHLMRDYGFTHERLATRLGKSRPVISNALRLLELPDEVKGMLQRREISSGHARAILSLPEQLRIKTAARIAKEGLSVREIEHLAKRERMQSDMGTQNPHLQRDPHREALEEKLRFHFGSHVKIVGTHKGNIEISFTSQEELERLLELLLEAPIS